MKINRREFLLLTAGLAAGGKALAEGATVAAGAGKVVNIGLPGKFPADGVYKDFRDRGIFVVRQGGKLLALSAICTHRKCKLTAQADRSFYCPCHGSTFDADGHVTHGPAKKDLPSLTMLPNEQGELLVTLPGS